MIKPLSLADLCSRFGGELINGSVTFESIATDSRKDIAGSLFIAIKGENFDAHDYLEQVIKKDASALVVEKAAKEKVKSFSFPVWLVDDTVKALGHIAVAQRENFNGTVFAITGSNGKTSVKGLLESIVSAAVGADKVFATKGNLNNHLGVPFSLLAINAGCEYAVIEMGASGLGEIDYLSQIASPHYSVVNNVSPVHVEGFGSVDNIAMAKSEIYDHLVEGGVAVINADDHYAPQWFEKNKQRTVIAFSAQDTSADVFISEKLINAQHCWRFTLSFKGESISVQLNVLGEHAIMNATAAASLALAAGIDLQSVKDGLEKFEGVSGRLQVGKDSRGNTLINDTYNASPNSMRAAIDVLAEFGEQKILIVGDMGELGDSAQEQHQMIGRYAKHKQIDYLFATGLLSEQAAIAFGKGGVFSPNLDELMVQVSTRLVKPSCILVKGSRSARMERAVDYLKQSGEANASLVS